MGCKRLDYLLLTHYDWDHVSGVAGLLARMEVDTLLVPEEEDDAGLQSMVLSAAEAYGVRVSFITEEERLEFGKGVLTIFPPLGEAGDNERGLAVLASASTPATRALMVFASWRRAARRPSCSFALPARLRASACSFSISPRRLRMPAFLPT